MSVDEKLQLIIADLDKADVYLGKLTEFIEEYLGKSSTIEDIGTLFQNGDYIIEILQKENAQLKLRISEYNDLLVEANTTIKEIAKEIADLKLSK